MHILSYTFMGVLHFKKKIQICLLTAMYVSQNSVSNLRLLTQWQAAAKELFEIYVKVSI